MNDHMGCNSAAMDQQYPLLDDMHGCRSIVEGEAGTGVANVISILRANSEQWVKSVSPERKKPSDKDVGETLEKQFGLRANCDKGADYKGIELKAKNRKAKTQDTLFSVVPEKRISPVPTIKELILQYGYPSRDPKKAGFTDLYCDVNTTPNNQGLYLSVNHAAAHVEMHFSGVRCGITEEHLVAAWSFERLKDRLLEKHKNTAWVLADHRIIDGESYFQFNGLEITAEPDFEDFLECIDLDVIVYNVRGGRNPTNGGSVDYGHPFRLKKPDDRFMLFRQVERINLTNPNI